jgi:hypothetical protein
MLTFASSNHIIFCEMNDLTVSFEKLTTEHELLKKIYTQLFDNMNLLIANESHRSEKENVVVQNQSLIIKNQEIIVNNQVNIIKNQKKIVGNQTTLELILQTQAKILNGVMTLNGSAESLHETLLAVENEKQRIQARLTDDGILDPTLI